MNGCTPIEYRRYFKKAMKKSTSLKKFYFELIHNRTFGHSPEAFADCYAHYIADELNKNIQKLKDKEKRKKEKMEEKQKIIKRIEGLIENTEKDIKKIMYEKDEIWYRLGIAEIHAGCR